MAKKKAKAAATKPSRPRKLGRMALEQALSETPISFKDAAGMFGIRPTRHLLYRWRTIGIHLTSGATVILEWFRDGGTVRTTREAVERFQRLANGE